MGRPIAPRSLAVVGGGMLGLAVGARAAEVGWSVEVLEASDGLGGIAGAASFAWANAHAAAPAEYAALRRVALSYHDALSSESDDPWYRPLAARAHDVEVGEGGIVDVDAFARAHAARILRAGGAVRVGTHVHTLQARRSGVSLTLAAGETVSAERVVLAAGTALPGLLATVADVPPAVGDATGDWGFVARIRRGSADPSPRIGERLSIRPDGPDTVLVQSLAAERALQEAGIVPSADAAWPLLRAAAEAEGLPWTRDDLVGFAAAARPVAADGLPVVGYVRPAVYVVLAHSGVTLAPLLGDLVVADLDGTSPPELASFRPDRAVSLAPGKDIPS